MRLILKTYTIDVETDGACARCNQKPGERVVLCEHRHRRSRIERWRLQSRISKQRCSLISDFLYAYRHLANDRYSTAADDNWSALILFGWRTRQMTEHSLGIIFNLDLSDMHLFWFVCWYKVSHYFPDFRVCPAWGRAHQRGEPNPA